MSEHKHEASAGHGGKPGAGAGGGHDAKHGGAQAGAAHAADAHGADAHAAHGKKHREHDHPPGTPPWLSLIHI